MRTGERTPPESEFELSLPQDFVDAVPQILWESDPGGSIVRINLHGRRYAGEGETWANGNWLKLIHGDDIDRTIELWRGILKLGEPRDIECRIRRADGVYRWHLIRQTAQRNRFGQIERWFGSCTDIDDLKKGEEHWIRQRQILEEAQAVAHMGVFESDLATGSVEWSDEMHKIYGLRRGEFGGSIEAFLALVHPDDREPLSRKIGAAIAECGVFEFEERIIRPDGETRLLESRGRVIADETGKPTRIIGACLDATARKRVERARIASEERYRLATEAVGGVLFEYSADSPSVIRSPGLFDITGFHPDEADPGIDWWFSRIHPDDLGRQAAAFADLQTNQRPFFECEYRLRHRDGSYRHLLERSRMVYDDSGKLVRVVGCAVDVTDEKLLEEEIRHAQKMDAVGRLAGGIAHDFNNLLTVILGSANLMEKRIPPADPLREELDVVKIAARRANALVEQLLTFSRRRSFAPQPIPLDDTIKASMHLVRHLAGEGTMVQLALDTGTTKVFADQMQLEQALLNLAINARDAMSSGGTLTIGTRMAAKSGNGPTTHQDRVEILVSDTGTGISAEVLPRIFEPFFTTKGPGQGTGLGLAVTHGIVEQIGGTIRAESKIGEGTTVIVTLPVV